MGQECGRTVWINLNSVVGIFTASDIRCSNAPLTGLQMLARYHLPYTQGAHGLWVIQNDADVVSMFESMRVAELRHLQVYLLTIFSLLSPTSNGGHYTLPPNVPAPAIAFSVSRLYDEYENSYRDIHTIRSKERCPWWTMVPQLLSNTSVSYGNRSNLRQYPHHVFANAWCATRMRPILLKKYPFLCGIRSSRQAPAPTNIHKFCHNPHFDMLVHVVGL